MNTTTKKIQLLKGKASIFKIYHSSIAQALKGRGRCKRKTKEKRRRRNKFHYGSVPIYKPTTVAC